jgi:Flp pilus assembly protein TadD
MRFLKGVILAESGKSTAAIEAYTQLTQEYPELPEPYNNLAVLYAQQNEYEKAREALEGAVRANPQYATAHENLGDVYAKLASQSYAKAQQIDPANASVPSKLALVRQLLSPPAKR